MGRAAGASRLGCLGYTVASILVGLFIRCTPMKPLFLTFLLATAVQVTSVCQRIEEKVYLPHPDTIATTGEYTNLFPYVENKRLFLVGEANHGSHEIFKVKEAFVKYLVEEVGLQDVVVEANFALCLIINEFITGQREGNPEDFAKLLYVWPYRTEEFAGLIAWMRAFNETRPSEEHIRLWGMDMQQAYPALQILNEALSSGNGQEVMSIPNFNSKRDEAKYNVDDSVLATLSQRADTVTTEKRPLLRRCLELATMQKKFFALYQSGSKSIGQYRDSCMAENVRWIYSGLNETDKVLVWAHNSHIQKAPRSSMRKSSVGSYIRNWYGDQAYYLGTDFNTGTFIYPHPREKLLTVAEDERHYFARLLDEKNYEVCFIPFTTINQAVLTDAVGMRYNMGLIRERYIDLYDAIFFVHTVTPTKMLD